MYVFQELLFREPLKGACALGEEIHERKLYLKSGYHLSHNIMTLTVNVVGFGDWKVVELPSAGDVLVLYNLLNKKHFHDVYLGVPVITDVFNMSS